MIGTEDARLLTRQSPPGELPPFEKGTLPPLLGTFISCICLGLILAFGYKAAITFRDNRYTLAVLILVIILSCLQTVLDIYGQSYVLAIHYGDRSVIMRASVTNAVSAAAGNFLLGQTQLFFLYRAWLFSRFTQLQKYHAIQIIAGVGTLYILAATGAGMAGAIYFNINGFGDETWHILGNFWQYSTLTIDVCLCGFLIWELVATKKAVLHFPKVTQTQSDSRNPVIQLLHHLIFVFVASGVLCLSIQSWTVAQWEYERKHMNRFERWSALPQLCISKIYTISYLVVLLSSKPKSSSREGSSFQKSSSRELKPRNVSVPMASSSWKVASQNHRPTSPTRLAHPLKGSDDDLEAGYGDVPLKVSINYGAGYGSEKGGVVVNTHYTTRSE